MRSVQAQQRRAERKRLKQKARAALVLNTCQDEDDGIDAVIASLRGEVARNLDIDATRAAALVELLALRKSELFGADPRNRHHRRGLSRRWDAPRLGRKRIPHPLME